MQTTVVELNCRTFTEGAVSLDGKEDQLVMMHTDGTVKLAEAGKAFGVYTGKPVSGSKYVAVRMLGKNGTVRVIQNGAIVPGAHVQQDSSAPTRVKSAVGSAGRVLGRKIYPATNGAQGDIIELMDVIEASEAIAQGGSTTAAVPVPTVTAATILALTFTGLGATGPEVEALQAKVAALAVDVKALRDAMVTAGLITVATS